MAASTDLTTLAKEIKAKAPFPELFKELYPDHFRPEGNSLCPFHGDSEPSLQLYKDHAFCHGEKRRFDHFDLLKHAHGGDFATRVKMLAARAALASGDGNRAAKAQAASKQGKSRLTATYPYVDEHGSLLFEVCRFEPKSFKQRRPDPEAPGRWIWNLGDVRRVLYRLPQVIDADEVYFVEGERDVHSLEALGLVATTSPQGAGKIPKLATEHSILAPLREKTVVILPDNDKPGKDHAKTIAASLVGVATSIKVLELPGLTEKQDVSDFIAMHGPDEAKRLLLTLAESTPEYNALTASSLTEPSIENLSDMGNASRMARLHGADIRYCSELGWLVWDGTRWIPDRLNTVQRKAKETVRAMYAEAATILDDNQRGALVSHARKSESSSKIAAMITLLPSEPGISVPHDTFDRDPWLLNCLNGTIDLRTSELRPHNRAGYITKICPVDYDPQAESPRFQGFIGEVMCADPEMVGFLQRGLGYAATGLTREQVWFFLHGRGANGKGTLFDCISYVLGDYAVTSPPETFLESQSHIRNDLARLKGARLVIAQEPDGRGRFDPAVLKMFTGEDTITARFLNREFFEFRPEGKLFFCANNKPVVRDTSHGFWRRVRLVPFNAIFDGESRDPNLRETLRAEAPGILRWLVEGCLAWQKIGLSPPEAVIEAVQDYRCETDVLADFIDECCVIESSVTVGVTPLYEAYEGYCEDHKTRRPLSKQRFNENLLGRPDITKCKTGPKTRRAWSWHGVGLKGGANGRSCAACAIPADVCPVGIDRRDARNCNHFQA